MVRNVAPLSLLLIIANGYCMEMRETVERMVMVRTTGSDLQPAATGYIYKKESDGPASVVRMGESEVMEHLAKFYEKPQYNAALIQDKENDEKKEATNVSEARVAPVVEKPEEKDQNDGIANEDYKKIFKGYGSDFSGDYKGFPDYLHGLGHFEDGLYHEHGGGKDYALKGHHEYGDKGYKGFAKSHKYGKGGAGDYHTEKYASFAISEEGGHKKDYDEADAHGKEFKGGYGHEGGEHGHKASHSKGGEVAGYHKIFDKNEYDKDHDFYDGEAHKGDFHKYAKGGAHHGSDAGGFEKRDSHDSEHEKDEFGKSGFVDKGSGIEDDAEHSAEEGGESSHHKNGSFGVEGGKYNGKSYGYEIKH